MQLRGYIATKLFCRASSSSAVAVKPTSDVTTKIDHTTPINVKLDERFSKNNLVGPYLHHRRIALMKEYHPLHKFSEEEKFLRKEFAPEGDLDGSNARLYDYYKIGRYVQQLRTPNDRIEFVNPFERDWTRVERKWWRPWHHGLVRPRKAWAIPPIPAYFDALEFYMHLTKSRIISPDRSPDEAASLFEKYYTNVNPPLEKFEERLSELLISYRIPQDNFTEEQVTWFLRSLVETVQVTFPDKIRHFDKFRVSNSERCESFWIRCGFLHMYKRRAIYDNAERNKKQYRYPGDDRRKLGELAFTMKDNHAVQIRTNESGRLKPLYPWSDEENLVKPVFEDERSLPDFIYSPKVYNLHLDGAHLWQRPGFDQDSAEPYRYGRLALKNVFELNKNLAYWKIDADEDPEEYETAFKENLQAVAISTLFNWLNGQAHSIGYTQYNDLDQWPMTSQLILSNGKYFLFAIGQLNTIAINVDVTGFDNDRTNVCLLSAPLRIFDRYDEGTRKFYTRDASDNEQEGLNKEVVLRILQMLL